jgi:hypothetical protein
MQQSYSNHARWHAPFHFVMAPILLMHVVYSGKLLYDNPGWPAMEGFLLALGLFVMGFLTRVNALKAQDRTIRLEERLRYREVLSPELVKKAESLTVPQIVALRFAPDQELRSLIEKTLSGQLKSPKEIKQAIQTWRPDLYRV